jgi:hypothetical protein
MIACLETGARSDGTTFRDLAPQANIKFEHLDNHKFLREDIILIG